MNTAVRDITIDPIVTSDEFRGAMRHLTGGVSVITAGRGRDISGMTVTSVASLSVDPPSLIVSINRAASSWPLLKRYGVFGVNMLAADQVEIAERFTGKGGLKGVERLAGAEWTTRATGVPLLVGALTAIDCEVEEIFERHSHAIVIGRVLDLQISSRTAALAYWQGQYVAIDREEDAAKFAEVSLPSAACAPGTSRNRGQCRGVLSGREDLVHGSLAALPGRWHFGRPRTKGAGLDFEDRSGTRAAPMKRLAVWAFYGVGALAIAYLALYAYAAFTGRDLQPGDPIHIFRKPDAPSYS